MADMWKKSSKCKGTEVGRACILKGESKVCSSVAEAE